MSYQSERALRLQGDLDAVHALAVAMREDGHGVETDETDVGAEAEDRTADQTTLAALTQALRANQRKASAVDLEVADINVVNAFIRRAIRLIRTVLHVIIPEAEYQPPPRSTPGVDAQLADLGHLRKLFQHAIAARDVKSVSRLAKLLVAAEKQLFHAQADANVLLNEENFLEIINEFHRKVMSRPDVAAAWEAILKDERRSKLVDRMFAVVNAKHGTGR